MHGLGESINYYLNVVMSLNCGSEFEYKIHCNAGVRAAEIQKAFVSLPTLVDR